MINLRSEFQGFFNKNTGCIHLHVLGFKTDDLSISWQLYHFCERDTIVTGPEIDGKIRSFDSLIINSTPVFVEKVDVLKGLLLTYVDGHNLQVAMLIQQFSSKIIFLQKSEINRLTDMFNSETYQLDFAGPHYKDIVDEIDILFNNRLEQCVTGLNYYLHAVVPDDLIKTMIDIVRT